jgi:hypothetical protein
MPAKRKPLSETSGNSQPKRQRTARAAATIATANLSNLNWDPDAGDGIFEDSDSGNDFVPRKPASKHTVNSATSQTSSTGKPSTTRATRGAKNPACSKNNSKTDATKTVPAPTVEDAPNENGASQQSPKSTSVLDGSGPEYNPLNRPKHKMKLKLPDGMEPENVTTLRYSCSLCYYVLMQFYPQTTASDRLSLSLHDEDWKLMVDNTNKYAAKMRLPNADTARLLRPLYGTWKEVQTYSA